MEDNLDENYMSLNVNELSTLIYDQIKDSYAFWKIKKAVKDELVKNNDSPELRNKIKNKVQEVLDKNGYFRDNITLAKNKFINCVDTSFLPAFYKDKDFEPLESVANTKRIWNEQIKYKVNVVSRTVRKPFIATKKKPNKDGIDVPIFDRKEIDDPTLLIIYDEQALFETILKIKSVNFAGVLNLSFIQLQTMSIEDMRKRFSDLNVTMRQIGVDDEKSFVDERIAIGEKLLAKDYRPFLIQYAKKGVPPTLR
jgi:hypothetical protein